MIFKRWSEGNKIDTPLRLYRCVVEGEWIDYNGHMTESAYLLAFGWASDALFRYVGIDEGYRNAGNSYYTVETHLNFYREVGEGQPLEFTTQILDFDDKRLHFFHAMYHGDTGDLLCTTEQMLVHVDMKASQSAPALPHVLEALTAIYTTHKEMPTPKQVGRVMKIRK